MKTIKIYLYLFINENMQRYSSYDQMLIIHTHSHIIFLYAEHHIYIYLVG